MALRRLFDLDPESSSNLKHPILEILTDRLRRAFGGQEEMFRDLKDKALGGKPMKSLQPTVTGGTG